MLWAGGLLLRVQTKHPAGPFPSSAASPEAARAARVKGQSYSQLPLQCPPRTPMAAGSPATPRAGAWSGRCLFWKEAGFVCGTAGQFSAAHLIKLSQPRRSSHPAATWAAGTAKYFHRQVLFPCLTSLQWQMSVCGWDARRAGETCHPHSRLPVIPSNATVSTVALALPFCERFPRVASRTFCKVTGSV